MQHEFDTPAWQQRLNDLAVMTYYLRSIPLVQFDFLVEENSGISPKRHTIRVDHCISYL